APRDGPEHDIGHIDAGRVASGGLGDALELGYGLAQSLGRVEAVLGIVGGGIPAVADPHRALEGLRALAADPERGMRLVRWLRREQDVVEAHVAALVARRALGPQRLEGVEILVGGAPALGEGRR